MFACQNAKKGRILRRRDRIERISISMGSRIRVLLAKPGLDGHDKGVKLVARALMEAGMEVIYLGMRQSPDAIVQATIQEDPHVVGLSILSGAHVSLTRKVVSKLKEAGCTEIPVIVGGTIPPGDLEHSRRKGLPQSFPWGQTLKTSSHGSEIMPPIILRDPIQEEAPDDRRERVRPERIPHVG